MKTNRVSRLLFALALASTFIATWSCNDDDGPSLQSLREDRLKFIEDSLRVSDSLRLTNNAGIVNYGVTIVNGSTSSIFANGRTDATQSAIDGAIVTISQYGKIMKDTTDASGIAVFNGFFRSAVNITVEAPGFTKVSYIAAVNIQDSTRTGTISFVGNIIPVFATTGTGTATISGRATIQTDLRNKSRELAPDGTVVTANIDASNGSDFSDKFLTTDIDDYKYTSGCGCEFIYVGNILQASYQTEARGTVTGGNYTITVPAAIDGLPLILNYSDVAADQTLFVEDGDPDYSDDTPGDRTVSVRTLFGPSIAADDIPSGSTVNVDFESFSSPASANAVVSTTSGTLDRINVTAAGSGYSGTPLIEITGGGGTGAAATATVVDGRVTNITLTNPGSGYTGTPTVTLLSGAGAAASTTNLSQDGTVTSVVITNSGSGYVTAPTVTITAPTGTGLTAAVTATGTATIVNGRVTGVTITNPGAAYITNPTITFSAPPAGGVNATANAFYSGQSVSDVQVTNPGAGYSYAPAVTFSAPNIATGVRATGTALINPITRQVTGINITNPGMGYTATPTVTLSAVTVAATTEVFLTGGSVLSADIISQGSDYAYAPTVVFTGGGGTGAAGTAVLVNGRVVGINITNGGVGYTSAPTIELNSGENAQGFATVTNGVITAITVTDGGFGFTGAPRVVIGSSVGGGATATATVNAAGAITGITVTAGGTGYLEGNSPSGTGVDFSAIKGLNGDGASEFDVKPGLSYINDIYYGTGNKQENN
jgi:hypothetical protein